MHAHMHAIYMCVFVSHPLPLLSPPPAVFHPVECSYCHTESMMGFRYRCQQCHNYQLCQDCFWRGHASGSHSNQHQMKEYTSWVRRGGGGGEKVCAERGVSAGHSFNNVYRLHSPLPHGCPRAIKGKFRLDLPLLFFRNPPPRSYPMPSASR